jgi:hypothetical protein
LQIVVTESGEVKTVAVRVPSSGQCAVIDTLRFTIGEETWCNTAGVQLVAFMRAFLDAEGFKVAMRGGLNVGREKDGGRFEGGARAVRVSPEVPDGRLATVLVGRVALR